MSRRRAVGGASIDLLEHALAGVRPHVGSAERAVAIVQTLFAFVIGHCTFHAALALADGGVAADPVRHPCLFSVAAGTTTLDATAEFDVGLAVIAAGLRSVRG